MWCQHAWRHSLADCSVCHTLIHVLRGSNICLTFVQEAELWGLYFMVIQCHCMLAVTSNCECRAGICCIVPPPGWAPPFALEKGTNGMSAESFRFLIRRQLTSHLCMRLPNTSRRRKAAASGRSVLLRAVACTCGLHTCAVWLLLLMQTLLAELLAVKCTTC